MESLKEQLLRRNPQTGDYEITIRVEEEIFLRALFRYMEEYHVDPTNLEAWEKAVYEVARVGKWLTHPRTQVQPPQEQREQVTLPFSPPLQEQEKESQQEEKKVSPAMKYLPQADEKILWEKAMDLPVAEWETLLTPLPDELGSQDPRKRPFYMRRFAERRSLEKLKEQLAPSPAEQIKAVAGAVNGNRLK